MNAQLYTFIHVGFCKNCFQRKAMNEGGPYEEVHCARAANSQVEIE